MRELAVILGGTGDIGGAVAARLSEPHRELVLGYLQDRARAERVADDLRHRAAAVHLVEGNVGDESIRSRILGLVADRGGVCHHLVHCVAVTSFKPLIEVKPNQWDLIFRVSARSFFDMTLALLEPLTRAAGAVVALSSHGSVRYVPNYGALGPAKAALEATVRQLAVELAPRNIRVNAVRAGLVEGRVANQLAPEIREEVARRTPTGRLGTPAEVAAAVTYLLGADARGITGQVLEVDGGFSVVI
jgi:enoyl-[acyl-carrier protein] reductase III